MTSERSCQGGHFEEVTSERSFQGGHFEEVNSERSFREGHFRKVTLRELLHRDLHNSGLWAGLFYEKKV